MNSAKLKSAATLEHYEEARWLRLTVQLGAWDQQFLTELAAAEGKKTPAYVGDLIRARLQEARDAAK